MEVLAELAFEYVWLMSDPDIDIIDEDYSQKMHESLSSYFRDMSQQEKSALSAIAKEHLDNAKLKPNEYRYTEGQIETLASLSTGRAFDEW